MRPTVLHVLEALETGCARHVVDVVTNATGTDHVVAVPSERRGGGVTDRRAVDAMRAAGAEVFAVEMRRAVVSVGNAAAVARVARIAQRRKVDILHGHSGIGGVVARLAAGFVGRPAAYTPNGIARGRLATTVERLVGRATAVFVAVSESEAADARALGLVRHDRIRVIPNGIELPGPEPADLRAVLGVEPGTRLVGSMGRVAHQKAPEVVVATFALLAARYPDLTFAYIGDGVDAPAMAAAIASRGIGDRVRWVRSLDGAARYLGDLDVFLLASRFEGGPYAPLEAMRAGTPVVLTDVTGSRDCVADGETGLLVPPEDPAALADAVSSILDDPDRADRIIAAASSALAERFDVAAMGRRLDALYLELADRR